MNSQRNWAAVVQAVASVILVVITGIYTYFAVLQWRAIVKSIEVSRISAESAKKSADLALSELRAWVTIKKFSISDELSENSNPLVTVGISNSGRTPALQIIYTIEPILAINEDALTDLELPPPPQVNWILSPGHQESTIWRDVSPLSPEIMAFYLAKQMHLYVRVIIQYEDIWGGKHTTESCAYRSWGEPKEPFASCHRFQRMD